MGAELSTLNLRGICSNSCQCLRRKTCQGTSLVIACRYPLEKKPLIHSSLDDLLKIFTELIWASCSYGTWSNQSWSLIRIGLWACLLKGRGQWWCYYLKWSHWGSILKKTKGGGKESCLRPLIIWAAALCSGAGAMQHSSCTASLSLQKARAALRSVPCRCVPHLLFHSSALWDSSLPLPYLDTLHRFSLTTKVEFPPGFYFNVLCWVHLRTESQMRWGLRFLLGEQEVPLWS